MNRVAPALYPVSVGLVALAFLYGVRDVLLPFALAAGMAFLLNPAVRSLEVRGLRRGPIVIFVFLSLLSLMTLGVYKGVLIAAREADEAAQKMPHYIAKGKAFIQDWQHSAQRAAVPSRRKTLVERSAILRPLLLDERLIETVSRHGGSWPEKILTRMPSFASGILPALEMAILVPFIGFFLMWEGPRLRDATLAWLPSRYVEMALNILIELDNSLGRYLRGICVEAFCIGCLAFVGFRWIGLDYALQIALVAGAANLVPYMGPVISGILAGAVAIFQTGDGASLGGVLAVCLVLRLLDDVVLQPIVLRQAVQLHPVFIVFSLMAGSHLYGFWGLLFAVPTACMAKVLLEVSGDWYRSHYHLHVQQPLPEVNRIPLI